MKRARAQSLVEFALVAPILILLAMSVWDGGSALREQVVLQQAARDGARAAATVYRGSVDTTVVSNAIVASAGADLPSLSSQPSFYTLSYPDAQSVRVDVRYSHALITPVLRQVWSGGGLTLQATATFYLPQLTAVPATLVIPTATPIPTSTSTPTLAPSATPTPTPTSTTAPTPTPSADLAITKTDDQTTVTPGSTVSYTIVVSNNGPSAVSGATVSDTLPAILSGVSWTCTASPGSSCGSANGTGSIAATVNLASGGSARFVASGTLSATATGTLTNTASVTSSVPDPDTANNSATDTSAIAPFDSTAPTLTVTASPLAAAAGTLVTVSVASDETLATAPTVTVGGACITTAGIAMSPTGQATLYTGSYSVPPGTTDCTAAVSASGNDLAGNTGSGTSTIQVDRTAPVLGISAAPTTARAGTAVAIDVTASETLRAAPALSVAGSCVSTTAPTLAPPGQATAFSATYSVPGGSTSCTATLSATGTDLAGNTATASTAFTIDRVAPVLSASAAPSPASAGAQVSVVVSSNEPLSGAPTVTVSGPCIATSSLTVSPSGAATSFTGVYTVPTGSTNCAANVAASGVDPAGNTSVTTTGFSIDRISPTLAVSATPSPARAGASVTIGVSASETLRSSPSVTLSGACIATTTVSLTPVGQATAYTGTYTVPAGSTDCPVVVSVTGADLAGNSPTGSTSFQVERSTPVLTVAASPSLAGAGRTIALTVSSSKVLTAPPNVSVSGSCIGSVAVTMAPGGQATSYSGSYTVPAGTTDCTASVAGSGTDLVGNSGSGSTSLQIDRTPPVLTVTRSVAWAKSGTAETIGVTSASTLGGAPTVTLSGACIATAGLTISPIGPATSYSGVYVVPAGSSDCTVNVAATASDLAGNTSSASITFSVDRTPPGAPTGLKANAGGVSGSVSLTWTAATDAPGGGGISTYIVRYAARASSGGCNSTTPANFPSTVTVGNVTGATVGGLVSGDFYCFYVAAVDAAGNVSQPSGVDASRAR